MAWPHYFVVNDEIIIVDSNHRIIAVLPSDVARTGKPGPA